MPPLPEFLAKGLRQALERPTLWQDCVRGQHRYRLPNELPSVNYCPGSVSSDVSNIVTDLQKQLKPGNTIQVIGQIESMNGAFLNLGIGLLFAAVFVYLLMVVNYQNFDDPFVVILALPATLCGIVTILFVTDTTLNVPS